MFPDPMPYDRTIVDVVQGLARTFARRITDQRGYPITGFTGDETFDVHLWLGDDGVEVPDASLTAQWSTPADGTYQIYVPAMSVDKGVYSIRVVLDPRYGDSYPHPVEVYRGFVRVLPSPSAQNGDPIQCYCSYTDLLDRAPWLETTHTDNDLSGFARQRHRARKWIDTAIARNAPRSNWNHSNIIYYGVFPDGFSSQPKVLQLLSANKLIITDPIRDAASHFAIHLIADALGSGPVSGGYAEISLKHKLKASAALQSSVAQFSENGTSVSLVVDLRIADGRTLV
jgi:hypothetical protein